MGTLTPDPITISDANLPDLKPRIEVSHFGQDIKFQDAEGKPDKTKFSNWAEDYISFITNSGVDVAYINIGDYTNDKKNNYAYLDPKNGVNGVPWIVTEFLDKMPAGVKVGAISYLKTANPWKVYDQKNFKGNNYTTDGKDNSPPKNNLYQSFELINSINSAQLKAGGTKFITHYQADGEGAGEFETDTYYGFGGEAPTKDSPYDPSLNRSTPNPNWTWPPSKTGGTVTEWPKAGYGYTKWLFNHFMPGVDASAASAAEGSEPLVGPNVPNVVFSDAEAIQPQTWASGEKSPYQFGIIKYSQTSWLKYSPGPMKAYTENYWFGENHYRPGPGSSIAPDGTRTVNDVAIPILNGPETNTQFKSAPQVIFNQPLKDGTAAQGYAVMGKGAISEIELGKYTHTFFGAGVGAGYSTGVTISDGGSGYSKGDKYDLNVKFSSPEDQKNGRIATGFIDTVDKSGAILGITVVDPGEGYSKEPTITLPKTDGKAASVSAQVLAENGYPQLVFPDPPDGGVAASGYVTVNSASYKPGEINGLVITEPGEGYAQNKIDTSNPDPLAGPGGLKVSFSNSPQEGGTPNAIHLPVNTGPGQIDYIALTVMGDGYNAENAPPSYTLVGDPTGKKYPLKGGPNNNGINPDYSGSYVPVLNLAGSFRINEKTQLSDLTVIDRGSGYSAGVVIKDGGSGYDTKTDYPVTFSGGGATEQATGLLEVNSNGVAIGVRITNPGRGYTAEPSMEIPRPADGTKATGTVHLLNYPRVTVSGGSFKEGGGTEAEAYAVTAPPDPNQPADPDTGYVISGIGMTDRGLAYKEAPSLTVTGNAPGGRAAKVEALPALASKHAKEAANLLPTITETLGPLPADWSGEIQGGANAYNWQVSNGYGPGQVNGYKIPSPGSGYTKAPTVSFSAPTRTGGKTATGTAILGTGDTAGTVTGIEITDPGYGYKNPPEITLSAPESGTQAKATATIGDVLLLSPRAFDTNYAYYAEHPKALAAMFNNKLYQDVALPKLSEKFYWPIQWDSFNSPTATDGTKTPQQAIATFSIESLNRSNVNPKSPNKPVATALDPKYQSPEDLLKPNTYGGTFAGLSSLTYEDLITFLNESATIIAEEATQGRVKMQPEDVTFQIYDAAFLPLEWLKGENSKRWALNDSDAILDLSKIPASGSKLNFSISSDASNTNRFGLVKVDLDALTGTYSVDGETAANTDDFRDAVSDNLINPDNGSPITLTGQTTRTFSWDLTASDAGLYAPVLINSDGEVLTFGASASDGNQHLKALGSNTFGFEDLLSSQQSDWDHDDVVVQISLN